MNKSRRPGAPEAWPESSDPSSSEVHSHRQARLERLLRTELQSLLRDEASDPALEGIELVSLTLSPDGGHARIAYAVSAEGENETSVKSRTRSALDRATGFLRARLATQLQLKRVPKLGFTFLGLSERPAEGGEPWGE